MHLCPHLIFENETLFLMFLFAADMELCGNAVLVREVFQEYQQ